MEDDSGIGNLVHIRFHVLFYKRAECGWGNNNKQATQQVKKRKHTIMYIRKNTRWLELGSFPMKGNFFPAQKFSS
jgi:hypothetical protein